jgi:hypothetical protein
MLIVRLGAIVLTAALLSGAACAPVHSERPVGARPVNFSATPIAWNGVWCTPQFLSALMAPLTTLRTEEDLRCWVVSVTDEANGVLALKRIAAKASDPRVIQLYVREAKLLDSHQGFSGYMFLSEEDTVLKGSYLWALAAISAQDQLLVWMTESHRDAFIDLVASGQLPGRIVEGRRGNSGTWNVSTEQTVILGDLQAEHLKFIFEHRGTLFDFEPSIIQRLPPTEPIPLE